MKYTLVFDSEPVKYFYISLFASFMFCCFLATASYANTMYYYAGSPWYVVWSIFASFCFTVMSISLTVLCLWYSFSFEQVKRGKK